MLPIYGIAAHKDLSELRRKSSAATRKRDALAEHYDRLAGELDQTNNHSETLRRHLAVMERQIKDLQKDIFLINSKQFEFDHTTTAILEEIGNKTVEVATLRETADTLTQKINFAVTERQATVEALAGFETNFQSMAQQLAELEKEKRNLSQNIAECLVNTSLEREKIESDLNNLSTGFLQSIEARQTADQRLAEETAASEKLTEHIRELSEKIMDVEAIRPMIVERKALRTEVTGLESDVQSVDTTQRGMLGKLHEKRKHLDQWVVLNTEATHKIESLETEVGFYERTITQTKTAQEAHERAQKDMRRVSDELMENLLRKAGLETALQEAWQQIDELGLLLGKQKMLLYLTVDIAAPL